MAVYLNLVNSAETPTSLQYHCHNLFGIPLKAPAKYSLDISCDRIDVFHSVATQLASRDRDLFDTLFSFFIVPNLLTLVLKKNHPRTEDEGNHQCRL